MGRSAEENSLFTSPWVRGGLALGAVALIVGATLIITSGGPFGGVVSTPVEADYADELAFDPEDKGLGDPDAPITITEYVDFQCQYCARQALETFPQLVEDHIETGNVYYRFRHFPLPIHPHAEEAALASECALEQDAFWQFKQTVFEQQDSLSSEFLLELGDHLDISDPEAYRQCIRDETYMERVQSDRQGGTIRGIQATPTILLNGEQLQGAVPYDMLDEQIQELL